MEYQSPFSQRLGTNYVPTPAEFDAINRVIDEQRAAAGLIETEIAELKRRLQVHTDVISEHQDLLTPARRIPSGILSHIFFTLASIPYGYGRKPHPVVTVSHVCHLWRTLAIDNPLLWAKIDAYVPLYPHERDDRKPGELERSIAWWHKAVNGLCMRVEAFAQRAKACPLDVSYHAEDAPPGLALRCFVDPADDDGWGKTLHPFARLVGVTTHWRSLSMQLYMNMYASPLLKILPLVEGVTSHMQDISITLMCGVSLEVDDLTWRRVFSEGTMNLYSAPLHSYTLIAPYNDLCRLQPNWGALSRLSIGSPYPSTVFGPQDAANVLGVTPNLTHCTIKFSDGALPTEFIPQYRVSLPKLRSLVLQGTEVPIEFADVLDLPSLTHLSALQTLVLPPKDENNNAVVELIRRYGRQLTDVAFVFANITPSALGPILDTLPNASCLELVAEDPGPGTDKFNPNPGQAPIPRRGVLDAHLLQRLTPDRTESEPALKHACLCPMLRKLTLRLAATEREKDREIKKRIIDLISSRRRGSRNAENGGVAWLEDVTVAFNGGPVGWMLKELQAGGVGTEGVEFSAPYSNSETVPTSFRLNVPGFGPLVISKCPIHFFLLAQVEKGEKGP
ncbi:hypothetical protein FA13DRAFT_97363 [Coprinellus micaceus]|uniref:Uncharacterized protein n=1 Tax=Coprinellus micaceus TaxID=71717 RepID=A0A4Y7SIF4_COPMI|nr:hypothetical protein FA13DRAFT_97363 [Coprinellus micaceus]